MGEPINLLAALFVLCIILLIISCKKYNLDGFEAVPNAPEGQKGSGVFRLCDDYGMCKTYSPIMTAKGGPLYQGILGYGRFPGDLYPESGCDLSRLHTGRPDGSLGSPLEPTTLTFPEVLGYFGTGVQTAYTPNTMNAMRTRDGLIHAGWVNKEQPGDVLTNSDRWPIGYKYQVGSSIQVVT